MHWDSSRGSSFCRRRLPNRCGINQESDLVLPIALAEPLLKPTGEGAQWAHTPHPPSSIHFAMAGGIPQDKAAAIAIGLEGILYGFSLLMFFGTIWALTYKQRLRNINRPIAFVAILLLVLSTAHMVVDMVRIENGFVKYRDTFPGGPAAYFANINEPLFVAKNFIVVFQTLVGDAVLIYRCYVVWQSIWIIIVPSLLWCSSAVTGILAPYCALQATSNTTNIFAKATSQWVTAYFASTLATNLLGSGLLAYRIWMIERSVSGGRVTKSPTMHILRVLMDAAILYSVAFFIALVCFVIPNNGEVVMLYMVPPIVSIAFYMVLIRIAIRKQNLSHSSARGGSTGETERGLRMKPLQVHISKLTHNDGTSTYASGNQGRPSSVKRDSAELVSPDALSP
ncbi:hypothetical protein M405DRAFT_791234 [Rhizopogon salebrosus TDB-379]|nr:hypothetical protein M405DRAFT_791234 [Rhizopogon salebrosus TDB-379]